jgi:hypothetical protein
MSKAKKAKQVLNSRKVSPKRAAAAMKSVKKGKKFI